MFSTDISYDEAASAIQKLDPAIRADYEENLSRLRKAETAYADEDGRQIIGYMDLAFQLECTTFCLFFVGSGALFWFFLCIRSFLFRLFW